MMKTVSEMNKFTFLSVHSVMGETDVERERGSNDSEIWLEVIMPNSQKHQL